MVYEFWAQKGNLLDIMKQRDNAVKISEQKDAMHSKNIITIGEAANAQIEKLGGKGYYINKLKQWNFNIAKGVIISTDEFAEFLELNRLDKQISTSMPKNSKILNIEASSFIKSIKKAKLPSGLMEEVTKKLDELEIKGNLIVRSSANIEDSEKYSFAGIFNTVIDVKPKDLPQAILDIYTSAYGERVLDYIATLGLSIKDIKMGIVIQEFINTDFAGVAFTSDPLTGDKTKILIEYVAGLGEDLVSGKRTPKAAEVDKRRIYVEPALGSETKNIINNENMMLQSVAKNAFAIENKVGKQIDMEWGVKDGILTIFQARAITTGNQ